MFKSLMINVQGGFKKDPKKCNEHENKHLIFNEFYCMSFYLIHMVNVITVDLDNMPTSLPKGVYAIVYVLLR